MRDNLDPLRHIEGFPLGDDADLHALSDPPHYTAYPNPHLADFIAQHGTPYDEATDDYHREPYVADVSEGKNSPIYRAHSYHTKVPYKAIAAFIEHYTEPGDIVFDGFAGSGMTGLAAQSSGRNAILCDLAPAATFIEENFNHPASSQTFHRDAKRLYEEAANECSWMFETRHSDGRRGTIEYTIWSEVFTCPYCNSTIVYADIGYDFERDKNIVDLACNSCGAELKKIDLERSLDNSGKTKLVPVLINYSVGRSRFTKQPDEADLKTLDQIDSMEIPYWYPNDPMMFKDDGAWGQYWRSGYHQGYSKVSDFYTKRSLWILSTLWFHAEKSSDSRYLRFLITSFLAMRCSLRMPYRAGGRSAGAINNLHIPSLIQEYNPLGVMQRKTKAFKKALAIASIEMKSPGSNVAITTQSVSDMKQIPNDSVDYVFVDPPFGDNIIYVELNFLWEAWLRVFTNFEQEAIVSNFYQKDSEVYRRLMFQAFQEMYRILKPGRWITVEFHNSKASIWNIIQDSLTRAGFLVAQVTILDKQQGSYKQVSTPGAVKNDLVINAYKPRAGFTQKFTAQAGRDLEADFVRQHLQQLPLAANVERSKEMLYSKYLAYYVQHGYQVQYNGEQFYRALSQWGLVESEGYWFSDEQQLAAYVKRKAENVTAEASQPPLFIFDERSAIQWLKHFLHGTPATLSQIQPDYLRALQTSQDQIPDLRELLAENFGQPDRGGRYHWPHPQLQAELDEARHQRLLRLFNDYFKQAQAGQRLKQGDLRKEALVTGFTEAYRAGRFQDILTVGHKLPKKLLEENLELFDFVEIAEAKVEG